MKPSFFAICIILTIATAAHGEPIPHKKGNCSQYSIWQFKGWGCAWAAGHSSGLAEAANNLEKLAAEEDDPDEALKLRNIAKFKRMESERYADIYRRKYMKK